MARRMVTEYGMSELGPVVFGENSQEVFLGRDFGNSSKNYSENKAAAIDEQLTKFVQAAYALAKEILTKHEKQLHSISKNLIKRETLSREEFIELFDGKS
jgi:cell division protease FtsH